MESLLPLASAMGLGMLAGARLYATVFAVGLLLRMQWIDPPAAWQGGASALADTRVLIVAGLACAVEFVADKIPWVDSAWDSVHTFVRPIGAVLLTSSLFSNLGPAYQVLLFLLAGGVALSGHSAKAATRLAVNHSPEPFSNIALSLAEDSFVLAGIYLLVNYPWVMAAVALLFLLFFLWLAPRIYRSIRVEWTALSAVVRSWFGELRQPQLTPWQQNWLRDHSYRPQSFRHFAVIGGPDLKGLRNSMGTLAVSDRAAVFFARRWGRPVAREIAPLGGVEASERLLLDQLVLVTADGVRTRFDLLAGQFDSARDEARRRLPSSVA